MYKDRKGNYHKKPENIIAKNRKSAYGIYIKNNKILMVKPTWINLWEFPGGGKKNNETLNKTLKREFKEETNLDIFTFEEKPFFIFRTKFYADDLDIFFNSEQNFYIIKEIKNNNKNKNNNLELNIKTKIVDNKEIKEIKYIPISKLN